MLRLPQELQTAFNIWSQFLAIRSSSADRRRRRVMQKSLKALRGTEYCRNIWDTSTEDVLHRNEEKKAQNHVVLRGNVDGKLRSSRN